MVLIQMILDQFAQEAHCKRIAALAVELGRRAGIDAQALTQAALLHDSLDALGDSTGLGRLAWQVVAGDQADCAAGIVRVCHFVDERMEGLEFEYQDIDSILEEIRSFSVFEHFDPALIDHLNGLRHRVQPHAWELPAEGRVAGDVFRTLRGRAEFEPGELESLALRDPALTASLLGVANSALFGRATPVATVARAVSCLGVEAARKVMLAVAMRPLFASAGLARVWSHSVKSAPLCAALAERTGLLSREEGLVLGLVHDIGAVAVQALPVEVMATCQNLIAGGCPQVYVERLLLGKDHGEIGAALLAEWHFPDELIEAVRLHHQPERSESKLVSLAYLAEFWSGQEEDLPSFGRVETALDRTGSTMEVLAELGGNDSTLHALHSVA